MSVRRKLFTNSLALLTLEFVGKAFPFITLPLVTRALGPALYGQVVYAVSLAGFFGLMVSSGFPTYGTKETEIVTMLRLMEFLNLPLQGDELEFPLTEDDLRELNGVEEIREFSSSDYICLHPGARFASRRWPPERFAAVGDALSRSGLRVIITGSQNEIELAQYVGTLMREPYCDSAGRISLGALGALLSRARLLVSNDTGVSHMAAALHVPSLIIVSGSDHKRWAPHNHWLHRTIFHPIDCRPCVHTVCRSDPRRGASAYGSSAKPCSMRSSSKNIRSFLAGISAHSPQLLSDSRSTWRGCRRTAGRSKSHRHGRGCDMGSIDRKILREAIAQHIARASTRGRDDRHFGIDSPALILLALARRAQVSKASRMM